jgi:radical SAM superfamily enzyme YgiQ (UPF0313 family)
MINEWRNDVVCERAHLPSTEKEYYLFQRYKIPIFGLESKHSLGEYDVVMTSLSFVPPWVNFPLMLKMSGVPVLWRDRHSSKDQYPFIMVGGSAIYGNFSLCYPVADLLYVGDAEFENGRGLFPVLEFIEKHRGENKATIVLEAQRKFNYVFVPAAYSPHYAGDKFLEWVPQADGLPTTIVRHICADLDSAPKYTRPLISYTDSTMGLGEVEISRGCRGVCAFCGIGWKYRPYRERSVDVMVEAMVENRRWGGGNSLCPIATEFAYYTNKRELIGKLCRYSRFVDPLSMRVDAFIEDEEFDRLLSKSGMNQLSLGVEGVSQRIRNRVMKGITEKDVLEACRIAIQSGFKRMKFFMISNLNETWEDFEEFFSLLRKVKQMKDDHGSKIEIRASWTPLFVEACTPLQWKRPTIASVYDWKRINGVLATIGVTGMTSTAKRKEVFLWVTQGMHLGDTRFAEAIVNASLKANRPFYTAFGENMKVLMGQELEKMDLNWDSIIRERAKEEKFLWDIVDRGVTKAALRKSYESIASGKMDNIVVRPKVLTKPAPLPLESELSRERIPVGWYIIGYETPTDCIPNTYWRAYFHRSAYLSDFPVAVGQIRFVSDRANRNWYSGVDFIGLGVREQPDAAAWSRFRDALAEKGVKLQYAVGIKKYQGFWSSIVSEYVVETDLSLIEYETFLSEFRRADSFKATAHETRYFSGVWRKSVDLKEIFFLPEVSMKMDAPYIVLRVWLGHQIGIRDALKGFLSHVSFSRILGYSVRKVALWLLDNRKTRGLQEKLGDGEVERFSET